MRLERVLPLDPRHTRALMLEFRDVGRSAFLGAIATAVVQGAFGGVGYAIVSVPQPVTWAVLTAFVSFVPIVGTALVYVPIAIWLLMNGHPVAAVFLIAWGLLVIMALTDYVIRPWLVGAKGHAHPLLTLVALVGGVEVLGLPGLIVAPILMSLFLAVLRIYERETSLL
jgi:predicted PurR-regulated permease PerM